MDCVPCLQAVQADVWWPSDASDLLSPLPVGQLFICQILLHKVHGRQQACHLSHYLLQNRQKDNKLLNLVQMVTGHILSYHVVFCGFDVHLTLLSWSRALSICSSWDIFCLVAAAWLFPLRSWDSSKRWNTFEKIVTRDWVCVCNTGSLKNTCISIHFFFVKAHTKTYLNKCLTAFST